MLSLRFAYSPSFTLSIIIIAMLLLSFSNIFAIIFLHIDERQTLMILPHCRRRPPPISFAVIFAWLTLR